VCGLLERVTRLVQGAENRGKMRMHTDMLADQDRAQGSELGKESGITTPQESGFLRPGPALRPEA